MDVVTALIQHRAPVNTSCHSPYHNALHAAAISNHVTIVTALVEAGADIEARSCFDMQKRTPLHHAAKNGCTEAVSVLLKHGAAQDALDSSRGKFTPLHLAIRKGYVGVVEALLTAGADVSLSDGGGEGYVSQAARIGYVCVMKELLEHGAGVNAAHRHSQATALHEVVERNMVRVIDALSRLGLIWRREIPPVGHRCTRLDGNPLAKPSWLC